MALGPVITLLGGDPTYYVTRTRVYAGPRPHSAVTLTGPTRIPAPAIETRQGLAFLKTLDVPFPKRLQDRVKILPVKVHVRCSLAKNYPGGPTDYLFLQVSGECEADRLHKEIFSPAGWSLSSVFRIEAAGSKTLVMHDRSALS